MNPLKIHQQGNPVYLILMYGRRNFKIILTKNWLIKYSRILPLVFELVFQTMAQRSTLEDHKNCTITHTEKHIYLLVNLPAIEIFEIFITLFVGDYRTRFFKCTKNLKCNLAEKKAVARWLIEISI